MVFFFTCFDIFADTSPTDQIIMVFTIIVHLTVKEEHVEKVKAKLIEASRVYAKDKGTIDWFVSQGKSECYSAALKMR